MAVAVAVTQQERVADALRQHECEVQNYRGYLAWEYLTDAEKQRWLNLAAVAIEEIER